MTVTMKFIHHNVTQRHVLNWNQFSIEVKLNEHLQLRNSCSGVEVSDVNLNVA